MEDRKQYIECPYCHARYVYTKEKFDDSGSVQCQNCGRSIQVPTMQEGPIIAVPHAVAPTYVSWSERRKSSPPSTGEDLLRIFVHGLAFSLLFNVFSIVWIMVFFMLMVAGAMMAGFIGMFTAIILGFALLLGVMAGLNMVISKVLWGISCSDKWTSLLGHGGLLFVIMLAVGLPNLLVSALWAAMSGYVYYLVQVVLFVVYAVLDGYIARFVALQFEIGHELKDVKISEGSRIASCPHCHATYAYALSLVDSQGNVSCQNCGIRFRLP